MIHQDIKIDPIEDLNDEHFQALLQNLALDKDRDYYEKCFVLQQEGKRQIYGARFQGQYSGYAILNWHPKYGFFKKLGIAEIQDINVVKDKRQKGIASALMTYCEDLAKNKGHEAIGVAVSVHERAAPAQSLYIKRGYKPDGAGVTYDRQAIIYGTLTPVDENLCLMLVKDLQNP